MIDLEIQLRELFERRAANATVVDALDDVLAGVAEVQVASTPPVVRRQWLPLLAAAAVVVVIIGAVVVRSTRSEPGPSTMPSPSFPSEAPSAPQLSAADAVAAEQRLVLVTGDADTIVVEGAGDTWSNWERGAATITDFEATGPAAAYLATCCDPDATIWRDGERSVGGIRIDYLLDGVLRATVDPASGSAVVGELEVDEPDLIDVALVDRGTVLLLAGGADAQIIRLSAEISDAGATPERTTVSLPASLETCGLSVLGGVTLLLVGTTDEFGRCRTDRAIALTTDGLDVVGAIRFPTELDMVNTDHDRHLVGVTHNGGLVLATFTDDPSRDPTWVTVRAAGVVAADLL